MADNLSHTDYHHSLYDGPTRIQFIESLVEQSDRWLVKKLTGRHSSFPTDVEDASFATPGMYAMQLNQPRDCDYLVSLLARSRSSV
jgi:hypothetical protein